MIRSSSTSGLSTFRSAEAVGARLLVSSQTSNRERQKGAPAVTMVLNISADSASCKPVQLQSFASDSSHTARHKSYSSALGVESPEQAQDVATSLVLSEAVYRILDGLSGEEAVAEVSKAASQLPTQLQQNLKLQWSLPHVSHRYLLAEGEQTLYVAFMGTKVRRDLVTNAAVIQELLWKEHRFSIEGEPAAHTGFVGRARSVPVHSLLSLAQSKNKKLVLCGHSLGGAVAEICALDLLHAAPKHCLPNVQAIGFATPAIGNAALASLVRRRGWKRLLLNYLLPEDQIGGILGFSPAADDSSSPGDLLAAISSGSRGAAESLPAEDTAATHEAVISVQATSTVELLGRPGAKQAARKRKAPDKPSTADRAGRPRPPLTAETSTSPVEPAEACDKQAVGWGRLPAAAKSNIVPFQRASKGQGQMYSPMSVQAARSSRYFFVPAQIPHERQEVRSSGSQGNLWHLQATRGEPEAVEASRGEEAFKKMALTAWTARFAYRVVTFPLWAHKSFVPVSQRQYLNPGGVSAAPDVPQQAALAAASMPPKMQADIAGLPPKEAAGSSSAVVRQRQLILWMHRLPTYRTRLLQIAAAISDKPQVTVSPAHRLSLASDAAPAIKVTKAMVLNPVVHHAELSGLRSLLEDCLKAAGLDSPWPCHWQQLLDASLRTSGRARGGFGQHLKRWWWTLQAHLLGGAEEPPSATLLLDVQGIGLHHATAFRLATSSGDCFKAEVIGGMDYPLRLCLSYTPAGRSAMSVFLAWLQMIISQGKARGESHGKAVLLRVDLPAGFVSEVADFWSKSHRLDYRSDFYQGSIPLTHADRPAKLNALQGRHTGGRFCQEC